MDPDEVAKLCEALSLKETKEPLAHIEVVVREEEYGAWLCASSPTRRNTSALMQDKRPSRSGTDSGGQQQPHVAPMKEHRFGDSKIESEELQQPHMSPMMEH
ncbi:hypothetical protein ACOSP7_003006 [Xanthoceras sorbifolium]